MEETNVGIIRMKSPKQGLTGAKYLTFEFPEDASPPTIDQTN